MAGLNKGKTTLRSQLWTFSKFSLVLCLAWILGYNDLSVAWVGVISVFIYIWMFENSQLNLNFRGQAAQTFQVSNTEQIAWLSKIFLRLWPYTKEKVDIFMRNQLQGSIRKNLPSTLRSFTFTNIELGAQVPQVLAVDVKDSDRDYIIIDLEILYNSDAEVGISIGRLEGSLADIQVHGTLRVVLTELNPLWPFFGKMNLSFVSAPSLSFRLAKAASLFNVAGFRDIIQESILDQLSALLVLPHFLTIPINSNYKSSTAYPLPQGVLRVHINRAKDLPINGQTDSIDPYCVVQVGAARCKTGVIQKTDHPMWNEAFEFLVNDTQTQQLEVECIDSADATGVGSLGSCYLSIASLIESSGKTPWLTLDKSAEGSVNITPTWLQLSDDLSQLQAPEMIGCQWKSVALLTVGVEGAFSLPRALRSLTSPSSYVRLVLGSNEKYTKVIHDSVSPSWGENFYFLSSDPKKQEIICEVLDNTTDTLLGTVRISLGTLVEKPNACATPYPLVSSSVGSTASITLSLTLTALVTIESTPSKAMARPNELALDSSSAAVATAASLTTQSLPPAKGPQLPLVSTPVRMQPRPHTPRPLTLRLDIDNDSSGGQSDLLDFDNWSETASNSLMTGGATYIVISRPDGSTVSEIVQNVGSGETVSCGGKENVNLDGSLFGRIQITLRYSSTQQKLILAIHQCCNLIPLKSDRETLPDPFVVLTLYNGRTKVDRKKTKHQKATLNPVFDETFEFKLLKPNLEHALLELSIKNKKRMFQKGKASMGSVLLKVQALDLSEARTDWFLVRNITESTESLTAADMSQSFVSRRS